MWDKKGLCDFLEANGIDTALYGVEEAKSVDDLLRELQKGEATLARRVVREISVVTVNVFADVGEKRHRLVEIKQQFNDGRIRERRQLPMSLSETMLPGEAVLDALARALKEELQVGQYQILGDVTDSSETMDSPSFPGILTVYHLHRVTILLHDSEYRAEGYQETESDLTTYFGWTLVQ